MTGAALAGRSRPPGYWWSQVNPSDWNSIVLDAAVRLNDRVLTLHELHDKIVPSLAEDSASHFDIIRTFEDLLGPTHFPPRMHHAFAVAVDREMTEAERQDHPMANDRAVEVLLGASMSPNVLLEAQAAGVLGTFLEHAQRSARRTSQVRSAAEQLLTSCMSAFEKFQHELIHGLELAGSSQRRAQDLAERLHLLDAAVPGGPGQLGRTAKTLLERVYRANRLRNNIVHHGSTVHPDSSPDLGMPAGSTINLIGTDSVPTHLDAVLVVGALISCLLWQKSVDWDNPPHVRLPYQMLTEQRYWAAHELGLRLTRDLSIPPGVGMFVRVNYLLARHHERSAGTTRDMAKKLDVQDDALFKMARHVLLGENAAAAALIRELLASEDDRFEKGSLLTWPLFERFRQSPEFVTLLHELTAATAIGAQPSAAAA